MCTGIRACVVMVSTTDKGSPERHAQQREQGRVEGDEQELRHHHSRPVRTAGDATGLIAHRPRSLIHYFA
jgi:hypothetical protein